MSTTDRPANYPSTGEEIPPDTERMPDPQQQTGHDALLRLVSDEQLLEDLPTGKGGEKLSLLGKGGFGEVWKVRYLNSEEAWKYLPKRPGANFQALWEALNARGIDHPSVVRVQDIEEDDTHYIIRMDLVRGRDLHRVVSEEGVLTPTTACNYALQVAAALEAAHRVGVLHLDLKPSNLILKNQSDTVMITDFGISATLRQHAFRAESGGLLGTPYFLAPEQLGSFRDNGPEFGPAVDIWALGISFYYLLSRSYPFDFKDNQPTSILHEAPRPLPDVVPYISESLWVVFERMLRRDPRERYASMEEVRSAFEAYLNNVTCPACQRTYPADTVSGRCPEEQCPEPERVAAWKEQQALLRSGSDAYAQCDFERAAGCYRKVSAGKRRDKTLAEAAERLGKAAKADARELAGRQNSVCKLIERGKLLEAVREIDRGRRKFSAAPELCRLRGEAVQTIRGRYLTIASEIALLVRELRFDDAKKLLGEIEAFLDYKPLRRALLGWEKSEKESRQQLEELSKLVGSREAFFRSCQDELEKHVAALELEEAASCLQRLQKHFPSPDNVAKIRLYSELQESLQIVQNSDPEALCARLASEEEAVLEDSVELVRVRDHCDHILDSLDAEKIPALSEVIERRASIEKVIRFLLARRDRLQADLETARKDGRLREEQLAIEGLVEIAERTDLLSPGEVASVRESHEKVTGLLDRAERKYREATKALEDGDYPRALLALEAADTLAPGLFVGVGEQIRYCKELIEEKRLAGERLKEVHDRIQEGDVELQDFRGFLEISSKLMERQQQEAQGNLPELSCRVLGRLLAVQTEAIRRADDESERLSLLTETVETMLEFSTEALTASFVEDGGGLNEPLVGLFEAVLSALEARPVKGSSVDERILHLRDLIAELSRLRTVGVPLKPVRNVSGGEHAGGRRSRDPVERISACLLECEPTLEGRANAGEQLGELLLLQAKIAGYVSDPAILRRIEHACSSHRQALRRVTWKKVKEAGWRAARKAMVPAAVALVAGLLLLIHFQQRLAENRVALAAQILEPILQGNNSATLPPDLKKSVGSSNEGFVAVVHPFTLSRESGQNAPSTAPAKSLDVLAGRIGKLKYELGAVVTLEGSVGAGEEEATESAAWTERLDSRKREIRQAADREIREFLDGRFRFIVNEALTIDPRRSPWEPLERAGELLDAALRLGNELAPGPEAESPDLKTLQEAKRWRKWVGEAMTRSGWKEPGTDRASPAERDSTRGLTAPLAVSHPGNDSLFLVAHVAYVAAFADTLALRSHAVYLNSGAVGEFESYLHDRLRGFLSYRNTLSKLSRKHEVLRRLAACRFQAFSDDVIGTKVRGLLERILSEGIH